MTAIAEKDIIDSRQIGEKEAYHGYGNDLPIMETYVKIPKGDTYFEIEEEGNSWNPIHATTDPMDIFWSVLNYLQKDGVDTRQFSNHIEDLIGYDGAIKKIEHKLADFFSLAKQIENTCFEINEIILDDETKLGDKERAKRHKEKYGY